MTATEQPSITFPIPELTKLEEGQAPSFTIIRKWQAELYENAMAIPSHRGGGAHGHVGMLMGAVEYGILTNDAAAWVSPVAPAAEPDIPVAATQQQAATIRDTWHRRMTEFQTFTKVNTGLKQLILQACPTEFLIELKNPLTGFAGSTARDLLDHVVAQYGDITPDDLLENRKEMNRAWSPDTPIRLLWAQIQTCRSIATDGGNPISDMDAITSALENIEKSGVFPDDVRTWRNRPIAEWTLANLRTHFNRAEKERNRQITAKGAGFSAANSATDKPQALAAKETDKPKPPPDSKAPVELCYCWSHGLGRNPSHTSQTCKNPKPGHQKNATIANMMGGSARIVRKRGEKPAEIFKIDTDF